MNRKQKIIISVTGIFLVALILMGLTYAYFLTQIKGNSNSTSISVTTANLVLTYGDGNGVLTPGDKLRPGNPVNFKTASGTTVNEKTFTVKNDGDATDYVVIVDNVNVTPEPFESNDFIYTLTCISSDGNDCEGVTSATFPLNNKSILVGNKIASGATHTYTLTMEYKETNIDQSDDMGKTFSAKIDIADIRSLDNPYEEGTLAFDIINNSKSAKNGTELKAYPLTKVAEEYSLTYKTSEYAKQIPTAEDGYYGLNDMITYGDTEEEARRGTNMLSDLGLESNIDKCDAMIGKYIYDADSIGKVEECTESGEPLVLKAVNGYEQVLSVTEDNYGNSYYYRGNVEDNYVTFADMCWRIVRIEGDGSVKLILEDRDQPCSENIDGDWKIPTTINGSTYTGNFGYTKYNSSKNFIQYLPPQTNEENSMATAFKNFQSTFTQTELSKLKSGNWCLNDAVYDENNNLLSSSQVLEMKINGVNFEYDTYKRIAHGNAEPTLKCNGTLLKSFDSSTPMYVATLTADEVIYAGGTNFSSMFNGENYYLINDYFYEAYDQFWLLSAMYYDGYGEDYVFTLIGDGSLNFIEVNDPNYLFRPAISLKTGIELASNSGDGTKNNPYRIVES